MTEIHTITIKKSAAYAVLACGLNALMLKKEAIDETGYLEDGDYVLKRNNI